MFQDNGGGELIAASWIGLCDACREIRSSSISCGIDQVRFTNLLYEQIELIYEWCAGMQSHLSGSATFVDAWHYLHVDSLPLVYQCHKSNLESLKSI